MALKNFTEVTASTGYSSAATSITLLGGEGANLPSPPFNLTWYDNAYSSPGLDPGVENICVTNIATDTLTIIRGVDGTSAKNHNTAGHVYKLMLANTVGNVQSANFINVKSFGAVGDGVTDDTVAIQAAIDAAAAGGVGGVVFLPTGGYAIGATLALKARVNIKGSGESSYFIHNAGANPLMQRTTLASRLTVLSDFMIIGGTGTGDGIKLSIASPDSVSRHRIERVTIRSLLGSGSIAINLNETVLNCIIDSCVILSNAGKGIVVKHASNACTIRDCYIQSNGSWGILIDADAQTQSSTLIEGNVIESSSVDGGLHLDSVGCAVINNHFENNTSLDLQLTAAKGSLIANNSFYSSTNINATGNCFGTTFMGNACVGTITIGASCKSTNFIGGWLASPGTITDNSGEANFIGDYQYNYSGATRNEFGNPIAIQGTVAKVYAGAGTPEGVVTAEPGSLYLNTSGGASTGIYVKESGSGNTGWIGK